jgi:hypothetical protein
MMTHPHSHSRWNIACTVYVPGISGLLFRSQMYEYKRYIPYNILSRSNFMKWINVQVSENSVISKNYYNAV